MSNKGKGNSNKNKGGPSLPPDAMKFAKQLGIDLAGLEPEAREIWEQLNKLSMDNPVEYERFVADQMQLAKEEENGKGNKKNRSFRPNAGFCVETTSYGGDGVKVRDADSNQGKKLYLNMCCSELIEDPKDKQGNVVELTRQTADGLEIPLIIGPVRKVDEETNVVDVIFSKMVMDLCKKEKYFKQQIIELAADWVKQETKLQFNKMQCEVVTDALYKGGLGDDKSTPVLFHVDEDHLNSPPPPPSSSSSSSSNPNILNGQPSSSGSGKTSEDLLSSTKSLLNSINKEKAETPEPMVTEVLTTKKNEKAHKPIIEEVGKDPKAKDGKSVKFSDESKSKDKTAVKENPVAPAEKPLKPPSKKELDSIQQIFSEFDTDLGMSDNNNQWDEDSSMGMIADLAKALGASGGNLEAESLKNNLANALASQRAEGSSGSKTNISSTVTDIVIENPTPEIVKLSAVITKEGDEDVLSISVEGLSSSADASAIDLQASKSEVRINCKLAAFVDGKDSNDSKIITVKYVNTKQILNSKKIKASLKKKLGKMLITVGCSPLTK